MALPNDRAVGWGEAGTPTFPNGEFYVGVPSSPQPKIIETHLTNQTRAVGWGEYANPNISCRIRWGSFVTPTYRATALTLYHLDSIMEGDLDHVAKPLIREHQVDLLAQLGED